MIGLDSVSVPLIDELIAEGRMPALATLRARGETVRLETPGSFFPAGSFPSLWTGLEVEEHGAYYPFLWKADEQRVVVGSHLSGPEAIWETIGGAGGRVLVIDPYEGQRPRGVVSTCLSGVQFTNRVVLDRWSSPDGALAGWERRIGRGRSAQEVFGAQSARRLERLRTTLLGASERAAQVVELALPTEAPDLLVVMLPAVHLGGHQLWDPGSVLPDGARVSASLEGGLRDVYASADAALGRIVEALPPGADVIVFSVLGMAVNRSRNDRLPGMLAAVLDGRAGDEGASSAWRLRATVPTSIRAGIASAIPDRLALELAARAELRGVDWSSTRAFCVPSDVQGLVRVNVRGRERDGIVDPAELDAVLAEIADGLLSFADRDGSPAIARVDRTRDVLPRGPASDRLPDLIVHWGPRLAASTDVVVSPRFGTIRRVGAGTGRSGNHTDDAWALVVPGRSRRRDPARPFRVTDLSHTALALCGVPAGGEPLLEPVAT